MPDERSYSSGGYARHASDMFAKAQVAFNDINERVLCSRLGLDISYRHHDDSPGVLLSEDHDLM